MHQIWWAKLIYRHRNISYQTSTLFEAWNLIEMLQLIKQTNQTDPINGG